MYRITRTRVSLASIVYAWCTGQSAHLHQMIVTGLVRREPGVDLQTATVAGLKGLSDPHVLERAAKEGRIVVSHEQSTMPQHLAAFIPHQQRAGLLIVPQHLPYPRVVEALLLIRVASDAEEWMKRIAYVPL